MVRDGQCNDDDNGYDFGVLCSSSRIRYVVWHGLVYRSPWVILDPSVVCIRKKNFYPVKEVV